MKRLIFLAGLLSVAVAQNTLTYSDPTGSLSLRFTGFSQTLMPGSVTRYEVVGGRNKIYAASKQQGVELYAQKAVIHTVPGKGSTRYQLRDAVITGGVRAIKSGGGGRAEMSGSAANYTAGATTSSLTVTGSVRLVDTNPRSKQNMVATGSGLTASLAASTSSRPLRTATLSGPVRVTIRQAGTGGGKGTDMVATGNKMVLDNISKPPRLTLTGNVKMSGLQSGATIQGSVGRAVLYLNESGEMQHLELGGGK